MACYNWDQTSLGRGAISWAEHRVSHLLKANCDPEVRSETMFPVNNRGAFVMDFLRGCVRSVPFKGAHRTHPLLLAPYVLQSKAC